MCSESSPTKNKRINETEEKFILKSKILKKKRHNVSPILQFGSFNHSCRAANTDTDGMGGVSPPVVSCLPIIENV